MIRDVVVGRLRPGVSPGQFGPGLPALRDPTGRVRFALPGA